MSDMQAHLSAQLELALNPIHLEVINESHQHSGISNESHFKLIVVSDLFNNLRLLDRHRFINKLFVNELKHIHALAMHTYTKDEWDARNNNAPNSPQCAGGSKS